MRKIKTKFYIPDNLMSPPYPYEEKDLSLPFPFSSEDWFDLGCPSADFKNPHFKRFRGNYYQVGDITYYSKELALEIIHDMMLLRGCYSGNCWACPSTKEGRLAEIEKARKEHEAERRRHKLIPDHIQVQFIYPDEPEYNKISEPRSKIKKTGEALVQERLATELNGVMEVVIPNGRIDILTNTEIIEVKEASDWRNAVGQIISYSIYYPNHQMRIHLFGDKTKESIDDIRAACSRVNINLTFD